MWSSTDAGGTGVNQDTYRIYYHESLNRLYASWRSASNEKCQNFWLFNVNSGVYAAAYAAAGLGGSYWSNTNRGNVGDDDYTLITVTRSTTNTGCYSNLKLYWNAADCGLGYYSAANGKSDGNDTPAPPDMDNLDKQISLASQAWNLFLKCGDTNDTKFNGVSIWNKVLSPSEVTELYNGGTPMNVANHSAVSSCIGWWNFESDGSNEVSGPEFIISGDSNIEAK